FIIIYYWARFPNFFLCTNSSQINGTVGHPLIFQCPYPPQHRYNRKFLCKGDHRNKCTDMVASQSRFTIEDNGSSSSFSVTITKIQADDTGTYWCGSDSQWTISLGEQEICRQMPYNPYCSEHDITERPGEKFYKTGV
uniref:Immunoglobulin V-set domain-containing protein n=1 Tax=Neolamprologus brichardi TaxID=32507 RepID=A0A3Q4IBJ9_NEOBR